MNLRAYQEELKKLIFFKDPEPHRSALFAEGIPDRLRVYRNNTRTNWVDTLDHDFALTRKQFSEAGWADLCRRYFLKHPPAHWELNASMVPFVGFLKSQKIKPYVKDLADYEWNDLRVFIDRSVVRPGLGVTNPTAAVRVYQHQIFFWVEAGAPVASPPEQRPEVLVFYRDSKNTCHIQEADPLMLLMMDHFRTRGARLEDLEPVRNKLLPVNHVPLETAFEKLRRSELLLA